MNTGNKEYGGKLRYDLVPPIASRSDAEVFTYGAGKYGDRNWEKGIDPEFMYAAAMRHIMAWRTGNSIDEESGIHHLAHARVNLAMIMAQETSDLWSALKSIMGSETPVIPEHYEGTE
jgi:hypothetical protein